MEVFMEGLGKICWTLLLELLNVESSSGRYCIGAFDGKRGENVTGARGYVGSCSGTLLESLLELVLD